VSDLTGTAPRFHLLYGHAERLGHGLLYASHRDRASGGPQELAEDLLGQIDRDLAAGET
jgi:hypothetical protein